MLAFDPAWPDVSTEVRGLLIVAAAFCLMPFVRLDFGQREHLAVILLLPYVWLASPRRAAQVESTSVLIGVGPGLASRSSRTLRFRGRSSKSWYSPVSDSRSGLYFGPRSWRRS